MSKILIVEDERNLGLTLSEYLENTGHDCTLAASCKEARQAFKQLSHTIILMDIGLPDGSGIELAKELTTIKKETVLLFLSAESDPEIRVEGLEIGAHDYITKPFALKELVLRLDRILAAHASFIKKEDIIKCGKLSIDFSKYEVTDGLGKVVSLSQKECAILYYLYDHLGEVVSRDELIINIWGEDAGPSNRTIDNYIVTLRKWCETDPDKSIEIISIRRVGYKLLMTQTKAN
ncbi:MAG: response regulator transcription factor [Bdellovibrionales bacterium]|nr:response regulator transcription factor [Bdellovibrionales bacterium]MBT3526338.1 response regulator transcription factor [Bdellovibrionales bacterium]